MPDHSKFLEMEGGGGQGGYPIAPEVFIWDVGALPLRDASVDAVVSDLPFGKRHGSKGGNKILYPKLIAELTRVCKVGGRLLFITLAHSLTRTHTIGFAVLLTLEVVLIGTLLHHRRTEWNIVSRYGINCGGLRPTVFVLERLGGT